MYIVVECGDDVELADYLRELGPPIVPLQHGWWTYAVSPDWNPKKTISLSGFVFEPVRYPTRGHDTRRARVVHAHGWRLNQINYEGPFRVHVELDPEGSVHSPMTSRHFSPYVRTEWSVRKRVSSFYFLLDPDAGVITSDTDYDPGRGTDKERALCAAFAVDMYRRSWLHPKGEGPPR